MRILLAVDESAFTEAAVSAVIEQFRAANAEVHVYHGCRPFDPGVVVRLCRGFDRAWMLRYGRSQPAPRSGTAAVCPTGSQLEVSVPLPAKPETTARKVEIEEPKPATKSAA